MRVEFKIGKNSGYSDSLNSHTNKLWANISGFKQQIQCGTEWYTRTYIYVYVRKDIFSADHIQFCIFVFIYSTIKGKIYIRTLTHDILTSGQRGLALKAKALE